MKTSLDSKFHKISEALKGQDVFYVDDVQETLGIKRSSVHWYLSKLVEAGYLKRIRNGVYAFNEWKGDKSIALSLEAEEIGNILDESGFDYYISGLDILQKYMLHVPEQYPIILFVRKDAADEVKDTLRKASYQVLKPLQLKNIPEMYVYANYVPTTVVMYVTDNFDESNDNLASIEKAFVDLYYAVTRNDYPLSLQEIVRIYENLVRTGNIDKKRLVSVAAKRSIQYDIRFIAESNHITYQAIRFVEILAPTKFER